MLFIGLGIVGALLIRKTFQFNTSSIKTIFEVAILLLGIILGLFVPVFYGKQTILKSTQLLPINNDNSIYLIIQDDNYYFNYYEKGNISKTDHLSSKNYFTTIRVQDSFLNQLHYCVEYPRQDIWLISFGLLPIPRYYYEFCVSNDAIMIN